MYNQIFEALSELSISEKAISLSRFFKTKKGEYAEGDKFLGTMVPDSRKVAKHFALKTNLQDLQEIIKSEFHEMRLVALLILIQKFENSESRIEQEKIIKFYLNHTPYINNWDLVDTSCYKLLGRYCFENNNGEILRKLSVSENMWEKRIAIVGTMYYIKKGKLYLTKELALKNLHHPHDLMHKANGWLLREMGKQNETELLIFLKAHYQTMPRTSLRYAIEKLDEKARQDFLKGNRNNL